MLFKNSFEICHEKWDNKKSNLEYTDMSIFISYRDSS